tara:strand:+ start:881 stop:1276 length:396 start_codon:yes stop_codon:yes gene_type:complete
MVYFLPIPKFLDRTNPSHPLYKQKVVEPIEKTNNVNIPLKKQTSLTNKFKQVVAGNIVKCILNGHDTFGKLRKVLNNGAVMKDREIRSALRYAKTNKVYVHRNVKAGKRIDVRVDTYLVVADGKRYQAVKV